MSELAVRHETSLSQHEAADNLSAWARAASDAARLVTPLVQTDFVPAHFKGQPAAATAAVLYGAEAGLSPLQSLQGIYVVSGKPAMYARTLMAVALSKGHKVWTEELTDSRAIVCGQRRGSDKIERVVWTVERARKAGYTKNAKYGTDPQSMLLARAQADVCRRIAPDALLGMAYTVEELEDEQPAPTTTMQRTAAKRTAKRAAPPPEPEPDLEPVAEDSTGAGEAEAPADSAEPPAPVAPITKAQSAKMHAAFNDVGVTDRESRLTYTRKVIGRHIESSNELTKDEASLLLDSLSGTEDLPEPNPEWGSDG